MFFPLKKNKFLFSNVRIGNSIEQIFFLNAMLGMYILIIFSWIIFFFYDALKQKYIYIKKMQTYLIGYLYCINSFSFFLDRNDFIEWVSFRRPSRNWRSIKLFFTTWSSPSAFNCEQYWWDNLWSITQWYLFSMFTV